MKVCGSAACARVRRNRGVRAGVPCRPGQAGAAACEATAQMDGAGIDALGRFWPNEAKFDNIFNPANLPGSRRTPKHDRLVCQRRAGRLGRLAPRLRRTRGVTKLFFLGRFWPNEAKFHNVFNARYRADCRGRLAAARSPVLRDRGVSGRNIVRQKGEASAFSWACVRSRSQPGWEFRRRARRNQLLPR